MSKGIVRFGIVFALIAALFSLQGTPAGAQAVPKQLRIAVGIDADTLDPVGGTTTTVNNMVDYFYEPLVDIESAPGEIKPKLAERWQVSRDGLSVTFQLRRGVTFHDGTPMNAAAVKFTIERLLDPKVRNPNRYLYAPIKSVETSGDLSVQLTLSKPSPLLIANLGETTADILSPAAV